MPTPLNERPLIEVSRYRQWWHLVLSTMRKWLNHRVVRWGLALLMVAIVFTGLASLVYRNWDVIVAYDWQIRPLPLMASFLLYSFALGLAVTNWGQMINKFSKNLGWMKHFRIYITTNLAQRLPGIFWHVFGRAILYEREGVPKKVVAIVSGMELALLAISGLLVSLLVAPALLLERVGSPWWLLLGVIGTLALLHPRALLSIIKRFHVANYEEPFELQYVILLGWLAKYAIIWLTGGIILFAIINIIYPLSWVYLLQVIGIWSLSGTVAMISTFSPSGLGIREITLSLLLSPFIPSGIGVIIALLVRILLTIYEALWAVIVVKLPQF